MPCYPGYGEVEVEKNVELIQKYFRERRHAQPDVTRASAVA